jgi:beta-mannosidase
MYFRVNGIPMFLKGANLIPFHTVRTQVTPELMNGVLKAATDGGC